MKNIIIVILVLTITNICLHILINYKNKNKLTMDSETDKFSFGNKFFSQGIFPTLIVIVMVADTMVDWIVIYIYFLILTYTANTVFTKYGK